MRKNLSSVPGAFPGGTLQHGEYLELVVEAAPVAIAVVNEHGSLVLLNAQAEELFGYDRRELLGSSVDRLVPGRFHAEHPSLRSGFVKAPSARAMGAGRDLFGMRKDGTEVPIEIALKPVQTDDGLLVLAVIVDITERKRAADLQRLVVEAAPNAMVMVDASGTIALLNAQAEHLFGYAREELLGRSVEQLVPERLLHAHPGLRAAFVSAPVARPMGAGRDLYGLRKDGTEVPIEIGLNPIASPEGTFVLAAIIDITERKRGEELRVQNAGILQHNERLEALNRELESFSYSVSHDLRAPVRAISGFGRAIEEDYGDRLDDEGRRLLAVVRDESERLGRLIDELLEFSRLGRTPIDEMSVDMTALARSAAEEQQRGHEGERTALIIDALPPARGDRTLLRQVWANLISNAFKYSATRERPTVRVSGNAGPSETVYQVADNGVGFDMAYSDKLFGVFQRLHHVDQFPGTGVGLAIVQRIVVRHGGRVWATSSPDAGATFSFSLPAVP